MRLERYQADDMRKAMSKVRAEMGDDAVIISSRRVEGQTEIVAASNYDPTQLETEIQKLSERELERESGQESGLEVATESAPSKPSIKSDDVWDLMIQGKDAAHEKTPSLHDMQDELGKLRKLFEGELAQLAWRDAGKSQPNRMALLSRLETIGIHRDIGLQIAKKVLPCNDIELGWRRSLRILGQIIKESEYDVMAEGGVIAMLGATGVGKTTTAAKIAAQFILRHGSNQVAFITTDNSRVGSQAQLISLGSVLGVPVQAVSNRQEMQQTLESFSERKLVIIDTAGISQRDSNLLEQFEMLTNNTVKIHAHLVLTATAQESVINETIKAFSGIDLTAAIVTKTDESGSIGAVVSGLLRNKLPAAFIGNGQRVPEDLIGAKPEVFVNNLIETYNESLKLLKIKKNKNRSKQVVNV